MMNRREFLQRTRQAAVASGATLISQKLAVAAVSPRVLEIEPGPQLFLDDYLIDSMDGLTRRIVTPERLLQPVLVSTKFGTTQPYMTVLRDADENRYRIWYNNGREIWHAESDDGIGWRNPRSVLKTRLCYGASLVDDGPRGVTGDRRFKIANYQTQRDSSKKRHQDGGMWIGFSPDGLNWVSYAKNPVLSVWPQGQGKHVATTVQDIIDVYFDPLAEHYFAALKTPAVPADGLAAGPRAGDSIRRLVSTSTSDDFVHWTEPQRIFIPDDKTEALLEFYGMGGMHIRGSLRIGFVRALRDDLPCDEGGPPDGIGYSTLATSRDGRAWNRMREPFLDRNPEPGSWDHAMTWIGYALPVGDDVYLYYGGYARGHKVEMTTERQIGLAKMKRDRYVAIAPKAGDGRLVTRAFKLPGGRMTVNADASRGNVQIRLVDGEGKPSTVLGDRAAQTIRGDVLAEDVRWPRGAESLIGRPVRLEFRLMDAALFGFDFGAQSS
jgi:hypothetical protein